MRNKQKELAIVSRLAYPSPNICASRQASLRS